jgi:hypothetical protein
MYSIDAIFPQLANMKNLDAIRWTVVGLIREQLDCRQDILDDWEAVNFANAISMLAMNVNALRQPTTAWLRLCLVDLKHALTPKAKRPSSAPNYHQIARERITYQQLIETLEAVVRQLDRRNPDTSIQVKSLRRCLDHISNVGNLEFGTPKFSA